LHAAVTAPFRGLMTWKKRVGFGLVATFRVCASGMTAAVAVSSAATTPNGRFTMIRVLLILAAVVTTAISAQPAYASDTSPSSKATCDFTVVEHRQTYLVIKLENAIISS
jgi:hypothetical protein